MYNLWLLDHTRLISHCASTPCEILLSCQTETLAAVESNQQILFSGRRHRLHQWQNNVVSLWSLTGGLFLHLCLNRFLWLFYYKIVKNKSEPCTRGSQSNTRGTQTIVWEPQIITSTYIVCNSQSSQPKLTKRRELSAGIMCVFLSCCFIITRLIPLNRLPRCRAALTGSWCLCCHCRRKSFG